MSDRKRKKMLVDWSVQSSLVLRVVSHWLIAGVVVVMYLLVLQMFAVGRSMSLGEHISLLWDKYGSLMVVFVTLFPVFAYDTVRLSHRFAGPMVSFRRALTKLAKGECILPVRFRKDDFWQEMAGNLNTLANQLGQTADPNFVESETTA